MFKSITVKVTRARWLTDNLRDDEVCTAYVSTLSNFAPVFVFHITAQSSSAVTDAVAQQCSDIFTYTVSKATSCTVGTKTIILGQLVGWWSKGLESLISERRALWTAYVAGGKADEQPLSLETSSTRKISGGRCSGAKW